MQQLVPVCISLFKCTSACPSTISLPQYIRKQAGTSTGPAMSLIVILGLLRLGRCDSGCCCDCGQAGRQGRQAAACCSQHKLVPGSMQTHQLSGSWQQQLNSNPSFSSMQGISCSCMHKQQQPQYTKAATAA